VQALVAVAVARVGQGERAVRRRLEREAVALDPRGARRRRRAAGLRAQVDRRGGEAFELRHCRLGARRLDHVPAAEREWVEHADGVRARAGDPTQCALLEHRQRPVERLVARERVDVNLVARAPADRVVRVAAEQLAPGEPEVPAGERGPVGERVQRGERLSCEQPLLGALVGRLDVHPRRVDAPQHVLEPASE